MKKMLLLSVVILSGCMGNQKFDCPYNDGVRCLNVSEVDQQVSTGQISDQKPTKKKKWFWEKETVQESNNLYPSPSDIHLSQGSPLRTQEEVAQIWVAAYEGEDGIYHQPTVLNTVLKPAQWVGTVPEINAN